MVLNKVLAMNASRSGDALATRVANKGYAFVVLAAVMGSLLAGAAWLWWRYGSAVFSEIAVAALAICF